MTQLSLLEQARKVTPNGSQTLSRSAAWYAEGVGPSHALCGQGAELIDAEKRTYIDYVCGLGAVALGYRHPHITSKVASAVVDYGVGHTLPHELEVAVATRLVGKIPCAEQVRFVKTGSEACAGAVRIARMATGREHVVVIGYHGWHDWYAASRPYHPGVPEVLSDYVHVEPYNDLAELEMSFDLFGDIAAVILEPTLLEHPQASYLDGVVELAHERGALVIFDEMICGFRWALAGGQEYFNVTPDLTVFGKAMGNGVPIACIAGPEKYMQHAWVVSGTFGGDILGLAALDAVLDVYEKENPIQTMWLRGTSLWQGIQQLFTKYEAPFQLSGWEVHPRIHCKGIDSIQTVRLYMTLLMEGLTSRGVLIHPSGFNISAALTPEQVTYTLQQLDLTLETIMRAPRESLETYVKGKLIPSPLDHITVRKTS